ncbi:hypothetical protein C8J57DRAFT_1513192 [Mycena rebaudengoi]|nr:hypothetical protein C8J57DRAFT_1513192 [Mycena rebaudengoi]
MPSFNTMISALAAVAFASLSFAAPVNDFASNNELNAHNIAVAVGLLNGAPIGAASVSPRASASLSEILTTLAANIKSPADQINAPGFSVDKFAPLAKELTSHFEKAVTDAQGLKGSPIETILGTADIAGVAALLAAILTTVLTTLSAVSALASGAGSVAAIAAPIAQVSALVATLLALVLSLLPTVLGLLLGLLDPLVLSNVLGLLLGGGLGLGNGL